MYSIPSGSSSLSASYLSGFHEDSGEGFDGVLQFKAKRFEVYSSLPIIWLCVSDLTYNLLH